jgi:hypothetical protein
MDVRKLSLELGESALASADVPCPCRHSTLNFGGLMLSHLFLERQ